MDKIPFTLLSPEKSFLTDSVDMVVIPGEGGDLGILAHHSFLIANLRPGLVTLYSQNKPIHHIYIAGGLVTVNELGCTILAEECLFLENTNLEDLEENLKKMRDDLTRAHTAKEKINLTKDLQMMQLKIHLMTSLKKKGDL